MKQNSQLRAGKHLKTIKWKEKPNSAIALGNGGKAVFSDNTGDRGRHQGQRQPPQLWGGALFAMIDLDGDTEIFAWPSLCLPISKTPVRKAGFRPAWLSNAYLLSDQHWAAAAVIST